MEYRFLQSLTIFFVVLVASHAAVDPEVYFKSVLPNTPMPNAIKHSLTNDHTGSTSFVVGNAKQSVPGYKYKDPGTDDQVMGVKTSALFLLEKDMHVGKSIKSYLGKDTTTTPSFVPRKVADSLPFTSNKLSDIYNMFKVAPNSLEAKLIKKTVNRCEKASNKEGDQYCATSLESMVDFAFSKLGKRVNAISTQVDGNESTSLQEYKVEGVRKLNGDSVVVCHQEYYAYAVHYCHKSSKVNAYMVSLVGENNVKLAKAISVCHEDTSSWNPKHLAFQVLDVEPGTDAICHFLVENEVAWVPY